MQGFAPKCSGTSPEPKQRAIALGKKGSMLLYMFFTCLGVYVSNVVQEGLCMLHMQCSVACPAWQLAKGESMAYRRSPLGLV